MKVLSLLQPWATLVVIGAKKIETRSWNTKYRGEILIHASNKWTKDQEKLLENFHFGTALQAETGKINMRCGAILGKVNIIDTIKTDELIEEGKDHVVNLHLNENQDVGKSFEYHMTEQEQEFGDYSTGRYGWLLSDPVEFAHPIPAKGSLGLWNYDIPDHFHVALANGGHATFKTPPSIKTMEAVDALSKVVLQGEWKMHPQDCKTIKEIN